MASTFNVEMFTFHRTCALTRELLGFVRKEMLKAHPKGLQVPAVIYMLKELVLF